MAYDMTRCPQTEQEFRDYFYALIGRSPGALAHDWEEVLEGVYEWQGVWIKIPPGVGPGIKADASWPFYGLTQQYSSGPKGRVFLPSNTPDELGYFTRCMQYLDDAAAKAKAQLTAAQLDALLKTKKGKSGGGLVWAWYLAGPANPYAPVMPAEGTAPPSTGGGGGLTEAQVQAMIDASMAQAVKLGDTIALRTNSGLLAGIQGGGPSVDGQPIEWIGKTGDAHAWESLKVEKGE